MPRSPNSRMVPMPSAALRPNRSIATTTMASPGVPANGLNQPGTPVGREPQNVASTKRARPYTARRPSKLVSLAMADSG
jgi:hypothetical protein